MQDKFWLLSWKHIPIFCLECPPTMMSFLQQADKYSVLIIYVRQSSKRCIFFSNSVATSTHSEITYAWSNRVTRKVPPWLFLHLRDSITGCSNFKAFQMVARLAVTMKNIERNIRGIILFIYSNFLKILEIAFDSRDL